jgi:hypothetical protein
MAEPTGPAEGGSEQRPIPDLGFFAGPATGGSPTFGGSSQFGGGPPTGQVAGPSPFGAAPTGQFGAPPTGQFGGPFGVPLGGPPPPAVPVTGAGSAPGFWSSNRGRLTRRIGVPIAILAVLGLFGVGRLSVLQSFFAGDLEAPASLAGQPRLTDPQSAEVERRAEEGLETENPGDAVIATYGDGGGTYLMLIAQRVKIDIDGEIADAGLSGQRQEIGGCRVDVHPDQARPVRRRHRQRRRRPRQRCGRGVLGGAVTASAQPRAGVRPPGRLAEGDEARVVRPTSRGARAW